MPRSRPNDSMRFDWIGFAVLSLGIGALQMMLDRGQDQDWFTSREIIVEAVLGGLGIYLFVVHMLTARAAVHPAGIVQGPQLRRRRSAMMFAIGTILVSSSSLMAPWLQNLANYPVETAGLIMAPRGIGTMVAMMIAGRVATRIDPRKLMAFGILMLVLVDLGDDDLDARHQRVAADHHHHRAGRRAGLRLHPAAGGGVRHLAACMLRTDGASLFSLFRNIGAAIGVSVTSSMLAHNTQALHAEIGASVTPFNRALQDGAAVQQHLRSGNPPRCRGARSDHQPAGADHRLRRRLQDDDLHHPAGPAAAVPDAATAAGAAGPRAACSDGLTSPAERASFRHGGEGRPSTAFWLAPK